MRPRGSFSLAASLFGASLEVVGEVLIPDGEESVGGTVERVPSGLIRRVVCVGFGSSFEVRIGDVGGEEVCWRDCCRSAAIS